MSSVPAVVAPWVRTRLRAAPGAALALALLVVVTACPWVLVVVATPQL
ncbi:hypothetical protein [Streptomyces sp. NPDC058755]